MSVREFYCLDKLSDMAIPKIESPVLNLVMDNSNVQLLERASEKWDLNEDFSLLDQKTTAVQLAAEAQEAYDITVCQKLAGKNNISRLYIFEQCRWSKRSNQTDNKRLDWLRDVMGTLLIFMDCLLP